MNGSASAERRALRIAEHVHGILDALGLDLNDPNLTDTPQRIASLYLELFTAAQPDFAPRLSTFPNVDGYSEMVSVVDVAFYSMCAHHLLPFFGRAHVAYVPGQRIAGLGELARVVDLYARRPQLQEQLSEAVVDCLVRELQPAGAMVVLEGRHLCVEMRGPRTVNSRATTSAARGVFRDDRGLREEFLQRIRRT